jgi:hypothetical protein
MTATDVINQLQTLPPQEVAKVRDWLTENSEESPALLAAVEAGLDSLKKKGARVVTREQLEHKVRQWSGGLH